MKPKSRALAKMVGYNRRDSGTHRKYNFHASIRRYKSTGKLVYAHKGGGHAAGEKWAREKGIDPFSRVQKYSKNSPSFDEGVKLYKLSVRARALDKMKK